jgi:hypothetical protein
MQALDLPENHGVRDQLHSPLDRKVTMNCCCFCRFCCFHLAVQALDLPENHGVRDQLRGLVHQLKQLPRHVPQQPAANGNGNGRNGHQPEGPQALLARCRELAMQVKVSEP